MEDSKDIIKKLSLEESEGILINNIKTGKSQILVPDEDGMVTINCGENETVNNIPVLEYVDDDGTNKYVKEDDINQKLKDINAKLLTGNQAVEYNMIKNQLSGSQKIIPETFMKFDMSEKNDFNILIKALCHIDGYYLKKGIIYDKNNKSVDYDTKAHLNDIDDLGNTALMKAVQYCKKSKDIENIKWLLDNGIDINAYNKYRCNALLKATYMAGKSFVKLKCFQLLLKYNPNLDFVGGGGMTALQVACMHHRYSSNIICIKTLLNKGSDPNIENIFGNNVLQTLLYHSDNNCGQSVENCIKLMIDKKVNVNHHNKIRLTPLFIACCNGQYRYVKYLIENGADKSLFIYKSLNITPQMILSIICDNDDIFKCLELMVEGGTNCEIVDFINMKSIDYAKMNNNNVYKSKCVKLLEIYEKDFKLIL